MAYNLPLIELTEPDYIHITEFCRKLLIGLLAEIYLTSLSSLGAGNRLYFKTIWLVKRIIDTTSKT